MLAASALFTTAFTQDAGNSFAINTSNSLFAMEGGENFNSTSAVSVSSKVTSRFTGLFPGATQQQWAKGNTSYTVSFLNDGRKASASFTAKGVVNYIITDCTVEHLPAAFAKVIRNNYASYQLFKAREIEAHHTVAYQAILENSKSFITLKFTADGVEQVQEVKKRL